MPKISSWNSVFELLKNSRSSGKCSNLSLYAGLLKHENGHFNPFTVSSDQTDRVFSHCLAVNVQYSGHKFANSKVKLFTTSQVFSELAGTLDDAKYVLQGVHVISTVCSFPMYTVSQKLHSLMYSFTKFGVFK